MKNPNNKHNFLNVKIKAEANIILSENPNVTKNPQKFSHNST